MMQEVANGHYASSCGRFIVTREEFAPRIDGTRYRWIVRDLLWQETSGREKSYTCKKLAEARLIVAAAEPLDLVRVVADEFRSYGRSADGRMPLLARWEVEGAMAWNACRDLGAVVCVLHWIDPDAAARTVCDAIRDRFGASITDRESRVLDVFSQGQEAAAQATLDALHEVTPDSREEIHLAVLVANFASCEFNADSVNEKISTRRFEFASMVRAHAKRPTGADILAVLERPSDY